MDERKQKGSCPTFEEAASAITDGFEKCLAHAIAALRKLYVAYAVCQDAVRNQQKAIALHLSLKLSCEYQKILLHNVSSAVLDSDAPHHCRCLFGLHDGAFSPVHVVAIAAHCICAIL